MPFKRGGLFYVLMSNSWSRVWSFGGIFVPLPSVLRFIETNNIRKDALHSDGRGETDTHHYDVTPKLAHPSIPLGE